MDLSAFRLTSQYPKITLMQNDTIKFTIFVISYESIPNIDLGLRYRHRRNAAINAA
jgi:hypothetical protein